MNGDRKPILVIGGGIAGLTASIEAAEAGYEVILIEKQPWLGGRVAQMHQYFPKLCPPACGLEINFKRLKGSSRITVLTRAEIESITGTPGDFEATLKLAPRYITEACTACGACVAVCPAERADEFNLGLQKTKAVYLPHPMAFPAWYAIDRAACPEGCRACAEACPCGAVKLDQAAERQSVRVAAVIAATGWKPYDAARLEHLGFGRYPNVVTNVILERLAAGDGPTGGKILRPSDGQPPQSAIFVQCAGSRDENHLPYCSAVCCAASLKQATYLRAQCPEAQITIFYIDIRTPGKLEDFYAATAAEAKIELIKGKAAKVEQDAAGGDLVVTAEDALSGRRISRRAGLVVLATGMVPQTEGLPGFVRDEFGFLSPPDGQAGFYAAGCAHRPGEVAATVQSATGAALKALQCAARSTLHG